MTIRFQLTCQILLATACLAPSTLAQVGVGGSGSSSGARVAVLPRPVPHDGLIALTGVDGQFGPGLGAGVQFVTFQSDGHNFSNPVANENGALVFIATISGVGVNSTNDTGVWVYRRGLISLVAREGQQVPGEAAGVVFARFGSSRGNVRVFDANISDAGAIAFKAGLRGGDVTEYTGGGSPNDDVLVSESQGQLQVLLRERGTGLPGHPGVLFGNPNPRPQDSEFFWGTNLRMAADGSVVMRSRVNQNTANNNWDVIVHSIDGPLATFYRGNENVPGHAPAKFWITNEALVTAGGDLFHTPQNTDGGVVGFSTAIWSTRTGAYAPILAQGDALPGGGTVSAGPLLMDVNAASRMVFVDGLDDFGFDAAIWTEGIFGVPIKIAETLVLAPGTGGEAFSYLDLATILLSDDGATIFKAPLTTSAGVNSTNDWGVWSNRSGTTVQLELREGDVAPGLSGVVFTEFLNLYVNATGDVAVVANLSDNTQGLWMRDANTGQYVFRYKTFDIDNPFDVFGNGGDMRIVTDILVGDGAASTSTGNGMRTPFNDAGQLATRLKFIDGSQAIYLEPGA